jgi:mannose-6-phosphate isomerase-like protein (cupin superfamily)
MATITGMQLLPGAATYSIPEPGEQVHWVEHLRSADLSLGTYCIPAGGTDIQDPHTEDEIYYVASGHALFTCGERTVPVGPGSTLFVAANELHRFHDITTDLAVLVFFAPAEYSRTVE